MLIGVSTGVLNQHIKGKNEQIDFFRESGLSMDGLELSFGTPDEIEPISKENEKYIKRLKFNTLHLPFRNIQYDEHETTVVKTLSELYSRLGSRFAVIHPDCVKNIQTYSYLFTFFPNISVENMTPRKSVGHTIEQLKNIINNRRLGIVLDFAHCMETQEPFSKYEEAFYHRITEFHISAREFTGEGRRHALLHKTGIMPVIRKKDTILIIEGKLSSAEELEKELRFCKAALKQLLI